MKNQNQKCNSYMQPEKGSVCMHFYMGKTWDKSVYKPFGYRESGGDKRC